MHHPFRGENIVQLLFGINEIWFVWFWSREKNCALTRRL